MLQKNVTNLTVKTCYLDLFLLLPLGLLKFSSSFFFFLIILLIYFWLCSVFVATLRLCLVAASRGYSSYSAQASRCGAQALGTRTLVVAAHALSSAAHGLQSTGLVVASHPVGSSQIRDQTPVSCVGRHILYY